jgi:tRNA (Thr-GGU) A37 N-methylase
MLVHFHRSQNETLTLRLHRAAKRPALGMFARADFALANSALAH